MHKIEVGGLYLPGRTSWPEAVEYNWSKRLHELRMFFSHPQNQEIQSIKTGKAEFALVVEGDVICLVFRFKGAQKGQKGLDWSDSPYTYHVLPEDRKGLPDPLSEGERETIQVTLVNADTGIVLAIRMLSLSPEFSTKLYEAIRTQAARPYDQVKYDRQLRWLQSTYDAKALLSRAIARCEGGA